MISEQYGLGVVYYSCVDAQIIFLFCFWARQSAAIIDAVNEDKARTTCVWGCVFAVSACMQMYAYAFYFNVLKTWP